MQKSNFYASRGFRARCFALGAMLVMGLWATAWPSEALARTGQPLAYVTGSDTVSVIDTGNNAVVATILVKGAQLVAIGLHAGKGRSYFQCARPVLRPVRSKRI